MAYGNWAYFPNDFNAILEGLKGNGIIWGLKVKQHTTPQMKVLVEIGACVANGTWVALGVETAVDIPAADDTYPRKDIITIDSAGAFTCIEGTPEEANPFGSIGPETVEPAPDNFPTGENILGEIWVPANETTILDADITDRRILTYHSADGAPLVFGDDADALLYYGGEDTDALCMNLHLPHATEDANNVPLFLVSDRNFYGCGPVGSAPGLFDGLTQPLMAFVGKAGTIKFSNTGTHDGTDLDELTETGAFTNAGVGDTVRITGGDRVTVGWYWIATKTDNNNVDLDRNFVTGAPGAANVCYVVYDSTAWIGAEGLKLKTFVGAPTDADFDIDIDGWMALDVSENDIYFRSQGAWRRMFQQLVSIHDGTEPAWGHSPTGIAVEGTGEFHGKVFLDGGSLSAENLEVAVTKGVKASGYNTLLTMTSTQIRLLVHGGGDLRLGAINLDWDRDLKAAGGFKQGYSFMQMDVAASQTAVQIDVLGLAGNIEIVMPFAGSVMGISMASNAARTAGTLTVDATVNGTATGLQAVLDGINTTYHSATQAKDTDTFAAGGRLGVKITTDVSWAPTTADIIVTVIVEM